MRVLIIGGGGREHALAWKLARSPAVEEVFVAPGNAGTEAEPKVRNVAIGVGDVTALVDLARQYQVELTVVGPEAPLVAGVVDAFESAGLHCLGPTRGAAELEGSKVFAKQFLERHGIPTAAYRSFSDVDSARDYVRERGAPLVVKVDGLAAGKGVTVAATVDQAVQAVEESLEQGAFGEAGARVVVEDCLTGEEASFIALVDGRSVLTLASSQDHKALEEGDTGPNTGGMGAYSPAPVVTPELSRRILEQVIQPTVDGMAAEGRPFRGFLYAGLMIGEDGVPRVLEYNVRLGDPETQPIVMRLRSDLVELALACLEGRLDEVRADWDPRVALGVVMCAEGYPGSYGRGYPIDGLPESEADDLKVFHAGTLRDEQDRVVTAGGRVLCVCALGDSVTAARERAYPAVEAIHWQGARYRRDIGHRAVAREQAP